MYELRISRVEPFSFGVAFPETVAGDRAGTKPTNLNEVRGLGMPRKACLTSGPAGETPEP